MLIQDNVMANATVTVCHDNTPSDILKQICLSADIIVVAVGIPEFLTADMIKEHQIIIDVGITRVGKRVIGDVHPSVKDKVLAITPVPGGVGPMTVAMLLYNTVEAAKLQKAQS
jgi:methylenetetrahydrofolate dehydrogenase (NADP+)/methenyltetrahydrofolate cyclohydrolase